MLLVCDLHSHSALLSGLFQWAPTLGGECYTMDDYSVAVWFHLFQWAPTLGGECYPSPQRRVPDPELQPFQWAPTLGGECYEHYDDSRTGEAPQEVSMGTHPWG